MKNENLKNAIVKAVEEVLDSVNHAETELKQNSISITNSKDIHFEVAFDASGIVSEGVVKFSITASKIVKNDTKKISGMI
ncbi:hypothetical protein BAZ12_19560 [Elizabethkingia miricola]|jgi:hypothetical protein|uniref:Uncharacterized protein n=1 Tax=Elizabethkingia miricola TaxID=172045 RepID=A0ABD4DPM3_ELIMR|nr:hypothetical protein [Elizabethkingia miricola]KUY20852.1 hypothetical protein ATB95_08120 [Elizabethkingia miricola]MCL1652935.1 hypothetical protein [Elizabethkingia miricola]OPC76209.1 hypothetical protein BAZ12_19560 [Elizabethkingia miricola]SPW34225.1 Uncharacterised protein [Elizabethkingia miricola]